MHRWNAAWRPLLAACLLTTSAAWGQAPEPTLPEVVVEPPQSEAPPTAPLPQPTAPTAPAADSRSNYPSLSDRQGLGLDSLIAPGRSVFDLPNFTSVVDREDLVERAPVDMFQALEQETGVLMQRTARGQASPFIRGLTGQQVLLLVDGIRLNNSTYRAGANQYFNTIDPGQIERIEVVRGPQAVGFGSDAIGGAINVVTRGPSPGGDYSGGAFRQTFSTADVGSYTRGDVEGWVGQTGLFGGASYLNVNDLDRGGSLGIQPFTNYDQYAGDIKFQRMLDSDAMVTVALQHFEQENLPRSDRFAPFVYGPPAGTPRPTWFDPQQRDLAYVRLQGVEYGGWINGYIVTGSFSRQKEGSVELTNHPTYLNRDQGEFDVRTGGLTTTLITDLDWAGRLSYGFDWYHDNVQAERYRYNNVTGALVGPRTPQFPDGSYYDRFGAFLGWDVDLTERLSANAGVRYERINLGSTPIVRIDPPGPPPAVDVPVHIQPDYHDFTGNAGLTFKLTDELALCGSIAEGFRAPNLDDLVATNTLVQQAGQDIPSINLEPEHSLTYEVGLKFDTPRLRSQTFVYWTDLDDNILRTPVAAGLFQRANEDSILQGVEWYGEYLCTAQWSVYGNFAYNYGQNVERDIPLSRIPPAQGVLGLRRRSEDRRRWIDVYTWLVARQDRLNFQDLTDARIPTGGTPGYQTFNVRAGSYLGQKQNHQVSVNLENIFDQAYRVHGSGVDGAGFNAILSYAYRQ